MADWREAMMVDLVTRLEQHPKVKEAGMKLTDGLVRDVCAELAESVDRPKENKAERVGYLYMVEKYSDRGWSATFNKLRALWEAKGHTYDAPVKPPKAGKAEEGNAGAPPSPGAPPAPPAP